MEGRQVLLLSSGGELCDDGSRETREGVMNWDAERVASDSFVRGDLVEVLVEEGGDARKDSVNGSELASKVAKCAAGGGEVSELRWRCCKSDLRVKLSVLVVAEIEHLPRRLDLLIVTLVDNDPLPIRCPRQITRSGPPRRRHRRRTALTKSEQIVTSRISVQGSLESLPCCGKDTSACTTTTSSFLSAAGSIAVRVETSAEIDGGGVLAELGTTTEGSLVAKLCERATLR